MNGFVSRGFRGRRRSPEEVAARLPPGQYAEAPDGWSGHTGRIDGELISEAGSPFVAGLAFLCGTNGFVETASALLLDAGFAPERIRTERFGPTG